MHCLTNVGSQMFMKQEGPVVSPRPYLPPMVATVVGDLSKRILEEGSLAIKAKEIVELMEVCGMTCYEAVKELIAILLLQNEHVLTFDGKHFGVQREMLSRKLLEAKMGDQILAIKKSFTSSWKSKRKQAL